jgi:hypothetical protein
MDPEQFLLLVTYLLVGKFSLKFGWFFFLFFAKIEKSHWNIFPQLNFGSTSKTGHIFMFVCILKIIPILNLVNYVPIRVENAQIKISEDFVNFNNVGVL